MIRTKGFTDIGKPNLLFLLFVLATFIFIGQSIMMFFIFRRFRKNTMISFDGSNSIFSDGRTLSGENLLSVAYFPIDKIAFFATTKDELSILKTLIAKRESIGGSMRLGQKSFDRGRFFNDQTNTTIKTASAAAGIALTVLIIKLFNLYKKNFFMQLYAIVKDYEKYLINCYL